MSDCGKRVTFPRVSADRELFMAWEADAELTCVGSIFCKGVKFSYLFCARGLLKINVTPKNVRED